MLPIVEKIVIKIVTDYLAKFVTPELVRHYEDLAVEYVVCKLSQLAKGTDKTDLDDQVVAVVAKALGVDLAKCPVA